MPLQAADGVTDTAQLGLEGARAAQFRVLQRDPDTRCVRWVLVDFVAGAPGSSWALVRGRGGFGGPPLATDRGTHIEVATGEARFVIRKRGFNFLDAVVQGADEIVGQHAGGGLVVLAGGTRYESGLDAGSETAIEENGPVKAVVRTRGILRSAAGGASFGYTVRLHFFTGQASCRAFVTLRNADLATLAPRGFDAAWLELPLRLQPQRQVTFGTPEGSAGGALGPTGTAHLFQGDNGFQRGRRTIQVVPFLTPARGLEVVLDGAPLAVPGAAGGAAPGWMCLEDYAHAVLAGMRDFATLFPSGFDVGDSLLSIELFSRHNPKKELAFAWGAHETREVLVEFGLPGWDAADFHHHLQYPLLGRCDFERYRDTGAVAGERRLVTAAEEQAFFAQLGRKWWLADRSEKEIKLERQYSFGTTGGGNQFDHDEGELIDFVRTGYAGRFQQGRLGVLWKADQAVPHSDDFDYGTRQNGISDLRIASLPGFNGRGAGNLFDDEHPHWTCMPLYYYLTGDERVREAIEDYGEWRRYRAGNPAFGAVRGGALNHFRLWSRCLRDVALLYEFTGQARYREDLRRMAAALTTTIEKGTSRGRNLERGYFYFGDPKDRQRTIHLFFLTEMNAIGVQEAIRVLPADDPLKEELRDYLYGLAYFTLQEAQVSARAIGYPYRYCSASAVTKPGTRGDQTGIVLTHGYEMSGDQAFIARSRALAWRVLEYQHPRRGSELSTHVRIYRWLHRDESGAVLLDPEAQRNDDGSYTLTWPAPAGAHQYIVKYGPRPLVENLGFDPATRRYRVDPKRAMNFWAASNLPGEPAPGPAGSLESLTTPPLRAGTWCFKVKVLIESPPTTEAAQPLPLGESGAGKQGTTRAATSLQPQTGGQTPGPAQPRGGSRKARSIASPRHTYPAHRPGSHRSTG